MRYVDFSVNFYVNLASGWTVFNVIAIDTTGFNSSRILVLLSPVVLGFH